MKRGPLIYKLDEAILREIFSDAAANKTPEWEIDDNIPLTVIHRASQVCKEWRDIILGSSSVWGQCMELRLLNQTSDHWRDLILERTGESMLTVTGTGTTLNRLESSLIEFFLNLLNKHWKRIQELSVSLMCSKSDNIRIWNTFSRPTENLKIFSMKLWNDDDLEREAVHTEELPPPDFQLFSCHAPSLIRCCVQVQLPIETLSWNTKLLSISNLRELDVFLPLDLKCRHLLDVLAHMPLLEKLRIYVRGIIRNQSDELASFRPHMPHLRNLSVTCPDLDIYPALLDHVTPSGGYAFHLIHDLPDWSELAIETCLEKIGYLQHTLKCYADSFLSHCERESFSGKIKLHVSNRGFMFRYCDCVVEIEPEDPDNEAGIRTYIISARLLDTMSMLHIPNFITKLDLMLPWRQDLSHLSDSLYQALKSIPSIVELVANMRALLQLALITESEILLPRLQTISLSLEHTRRGHMLCILPFLVQRSNIGAPIKNLRIKHNGGNTDFRYLDAMVGLRVSWMEGGKMAEYVCGSGNEDRLILLDTEDATCPSIF
ncbi:hypothetical protein HYPSUDRAFT_36225 [Hypholoma sublateritium FD-334 SS-4]|uniref:F-box domain-containing protein n=1 Tax=Hypholoma sublateritium (strain FD-334 SS-4) TaxID=945553 RepID=A0A0D2MR83_HYPSF|nr:hypothetical protein HYPSUDRAFT_36225 [Hypholoma sublateritium FD-334 SS-4]